MSEPNEAGTGSLTIAAGTKRAIFDSLRCEPAVVVYLVDVVVENRGLSEA